MKIKGAGDEIAQHEMLGVEAEMGGWRQVHLSDLGAVVFDV